MEILIRGFMTKNNIEDLIEALEVYGINLDDLTSKALIEINIKRLESARTTIQFSIENFAKSLGISKQRYHAIIKEGAKVDTLEKYLLIARKLQEKHSKKK